MGTIKYVSGDLFTVTNGVLAHACNCHGVWGGGIASVFKRKFPNAYVKYRDYCKAHSPKELLGTSYVIDDGNYQIACLFTSDGSTNEEVAQYTQQSVSQLARSLPKGTTINMPQINAGIFAVPWELTENALKQVDAPITVYKY